MAKHLGAAGSFAGRYGLALLLFGSLLSFSRLANVGAQNPADKGDAAKQPEVKKDKDGLFDDAEIDESKVKPNRNAPPPAIDLKQASRDPKQHPLVKNLFAELAEPHDVVKYRHGDASNKPFRQSGYSHVQPLEKFYGDKLPRERLTVEEFQKEGEIKKVEVPIYEITSIQPYEKVAADEVAKFMRRPPSDFSPPLPRYKQAVAAEQALSAVLVWHESARSRGVRVGAEWDGVVAGLRKQLLTVLLDELKELTTAKDWDGAFALAQRLSETYPDDPTLAAPLATLIKQSLASPLDPTLRQRTRQQLEQLHEKYPNDGAINEIINDLKKKAQDFYDRAQQLGKSSDPKDAKEAQELVAKAVDTWPNLPGLRAYSNQAKTKYPILRVGVRALPKYMSPGLACTDSEHRVVEFLFESLVKFSPDAAGMGRYRPALAEGRPDVISRGRQFVLPENSFWSDDELTNINTADIVQTVAQLKKGHGNGLSAAWGELFADNPVSSGGAHKVNIKLNQGYVEPLSLMTFKILPRRDALPQTMVRAVGPQAPFGYDEQAFAEKPVGSGPFKFMPVKHPPDGGREYLSFIANPHYRNRANKLGLPRFSEVRLFTYTDATKEIDASKHFLDLLLDLTADEAAKLKDVGPKEGFRVILPEPNATLPNRRVYFLAINHRREELQKAVLRRALVRAINREKLLDQHFRGPLGQQVHKALNGPFPAGSWANSPNVTGGKVNRGSPDPFDPVNAESLFKQLKADDRYKPPTLSLKYPSGDAALKNAMNALADQIEKTLAGVKITLEEVSPWTLRDAVEKTHDFDLAYYHYDFPDDTFSLWPLFGGDENYLGYRNDQIVTPLLRESVHFCEFEKVQDHARQLHLAFDLDVPLVPLWQLDPLLAVHDDVKTVPFDRHLVFTDIELWQLGKQRD